MQIKRRVTSAVGAATLSVALLGVWATPASASVDEAKAAKLQKSLDAIVAAGAPAAVGNLRTDEGSWSGASGISDTASGRAAQPNDQFRIGSITKTMVAVAMLQLVEDGKVSLDAPISTYLGLVVPTADEITVRQLLMHRSGLPNYTAKLASSPEILATLGIKTNTPEELIKLAITGEPAPKAPGEYLYSNTNYLIAGEIVQKVSGQPLSEQLRHEVFLPAGMNHTIYRQEDPKISGDQLRGYIDFPDDGMPVADISDFNPSFYQGSGAVISTAADLNLFFDALTSGKLLGPASVKEMTTVAPDSSYGLGIFAFPVACAPGGVAIGHDGSVFGYGSFSVSTIDGTTQASVGVNTFIPLSPDVTKALVSFATDNLCEASGA